MAHEPPRRVVAILFRRVGDSLLATPALRAVKRAFPAAEMIVVAERHVARVFEGNPHIDAIEAVDAPPSVLRLAAVMRRRGVPDAVLDFLSDPRSAAASLLSGARTRVGFARRGRGLFYSHAFAPQREARPQYSALHKLGLAAALTETGTDAKTDFYLLPPDLEFARRVGDERGWQTAPCIAALFAHSRRHYKRWPLENHAQVIKRLRETRGVIPLLLETPDARESVAELAALAEVDDSMIVRPQTLGQLAAVLSRCAVLIGNDGGLKHLAVALGVPTVTVFLNESTAYWTPPDDSRHSGLGPGVVSVDEVLAAAAPFLQDSAA